MTVPCTNAYPLQRFHEYSSTTFSVILLTDRPTNQQTRMKTYPPWQRQQHVDIEFWCRHRLTDSGAACFGADTRLQQLLRVARVDLAVQVIGHVACGAVHSTACQHRRRWTTSTDDASTTLIIVGTILRFTTTTTNSRRSDRGVQKTEIRFWYKNPKWILTIQSAVQIS